MSKRDRYLIWFGFSAASLLISIAERKWLAAAFMAVGFFGSTWLIVSQTKEKIGP
jgi:hypothetical protein